MEDNQVFKGVVVWFDSKKGYGFIARDDGGGDLFVHFSNIVSDGFKTLEAEQNVEYELGKNHHGEQCINVKVVD